MPKISIIVPVYKAEIYLRRCVDSILAQSFTDFELILVDDGSPDNCPEICDAYAVRDNRVKVIHKKNAGVSSARNTGMDLAQAKYIMFCDSDDYVDSDWCKVLYETILTHPTSFVVSNFMRVCEGKTKTHFPQFQCMETEISYYEMFCMGLSGSTWNKIYDHKILKVHNINFNPNIYIAEDVDFNVRYCQYCNNILYIDKPLYYYNDTPNSALNSYHADWLGLHLFPFYIRVPLIEKEHIGDYCDSWLSTFINAFQVTFDKRNKVSFLSKLRYNQRMLNTKEFQYCLDHATGAKENPLVLKLLKTRNYYLFYLFQKIVHFKSIILHAYKRKNYKNKENKL